MFIVISWLFMAGVPLLAAVGLWCLIYSKGNYHRHLVWTAVVFLSALALFFGGIILLGFFGLTWRTAPSAILCTTLLISGWVGIILTLICFVEARLPELSAALRRTAKGVVAFFVAVVFLVTLWAGPLALLFVFGDEERVVEREGQTLLEVDDGFLDIHYSYYLYHGPLVRGTERIYDGPVRIDGYMG